MSDLTNDPLKKDDVQWRLDQFVKTLEGGQIDPKRLIGSIRGPLRVHDELAIDCIICIKRITGHYYDVGLIREIEHPRVKGWMLKGVFLCRDLNGACGMLAAFV